MEGILERYKEKEWGFVVEIKKERNKLSKYLQIELIYLGCGSSGVKEEDE